jgi:hypothetical protein
MDDPKHIPSEHVIKIAEIMARHGGLPGRCIKHADVFLRCFHAAMELSKQTGIVKVESAYAMVDYQESPPTVGLITVPREPTPAMLEEMVHAIQMLPGYIEVQSQDEIAKAVWAAGIKAAEG